MEDSIANKRQMLREEIEGGRYATLTDLVMHRVSGLMPRIKRPISVWISALGICLIFLIPSVIDVIRFGTSNVVRELWSNASMLGVLFVTMVGTWHYRVYMDHQISQYVIDAIQSVDDLDNLTKGYAGISNKRKQWLSTILLACALFVYYMVASVITAQAYPSAGFVATISLVCFFMSAYALEFIQWMILDVRLSHYSYNVFFADPSSSELLEQLSYLFNAVVYLIATITGLMTFLFAYWNKTVNNPAGFIASLIFVGVSTYGPLLIAFFVNQSALNRIIRRARRKSLNQIQAQIDHLQNKNAVPDQETISQIRGLLEYHDYIKSRRTSMIDIQAGLNFLNSLLFPVLGFLIGNLKDIIDFIIK